MTAIADKLLIFFIDLILPLSLGYALARQGRLRRVFDRVMVINLVTLTPLLAFTTVWELPISANLLTLPLLGVVMQVVPGAIGYLYARRRFDDPLSRGSFVIASTLANRGSVGILTIVILFPKVGFGQTQLVMMLSSFVTYGICFPLAQRIRAGYGGQAASGVSWRTVLTNPNMTPAWGVLLGLGLSATGAPCPRFFAAMNPILEHLWIWLFILPLGFSLSFRAIGRFWRDALALSAIRFLLAPAVMYVVALAAGLDETSKWIVVVLAASPTAVLAVITSKLNDLDMDLAMACFVMNTMLYLVTVLPAVLLIFGG